MKIISFFFSSRLYAALAESATPDLSFPTTATTTTSQPHYSNVHYAMHPRMKPEYFKNCNLFTEEKPTRRFAAFSTGKPHQTASAKTQSILQQETAAAFDESDDESSDDDDEAMYCGHEDWSIFPQSQPDWSPPSSSAFLAVSKSIADEMNPDGVASIKPIKPAENDASPLNELNLMYELHTMQREIENYMDNCRLNGLSGDDFIAKATELIRERAKGREKEVSMEKMEYLRVYTCRLNTFNNWPGLVGLKISPASLCRAGLHYSGQSDKVILKFIKYF